METPSLLPLTLPQNTLDFSILGGAGEMIANCTRITWEEPWLLHLRLTSLKTSRIHLFEPKFPSDQFVSTRELIDLAKKLPGSIMLGAQAASAIWNNKETMLRPEWERRKDGNGRVIILGGTIFRMKAGETDYEYVYYFSCSWHERKWSCSIRPLDGSRIMGGGSVLMYKV